MASSQQAEDIPHLQSFITAPGQTDVLFIVTVIFIIGLVLILGVVYFKLHALPEQMGHGYNSTQLQAVGVLSLLSLVTHNNMFWIAALLLVTIKLPDFITPLNTMAKSLENMTNQKEDLSVSAKLPDLTISLNSIAQSLERMNDRSTSPPIEKAADKPVEKKDK